MKKELRRTSGEDPPASVITPSPSSTRVYLAQHNRADRAYLLSTTTPEP